MMNSCHQYIMTYSIASSLGSSPLSMGRSLGMRLLYLNEHSCTKKITMLQKHHAENNIETTYYNSIVNKAYIASNHSPFVPKVLVYT